MGVGDPERTILARSVRDGITMGEAMDRIDAEAATAKRAHPLTYFYYVSFSHSRGFGACEIGVSAPLQSYNDVKGAAGRIASSLGSVDVVVLAFQLLRTEES